jgi:nitrogen fixation/metabolism regulation signal transduction histidine kinase
MLDDVNGLDDESLDALPYGVVCLSETGRVVKMNRTASEKSGIQSWRAVGRDYAREIAPVLKKRAASVVTVTSAACRPLGPQQARRA